MVPLESETTTWGPYEPNRDCSRGFCSIYCPHWCYTIFPPPPPALDFSDDSSSGSAFPPLVIAIIGILASAFLLVGYYTLFSKYCGSFEFLRRRHFARGNARVDVSDGHAGGGGGGGQLRDNEAWRLTVSEGLDDSVIRTIAVCKYKKGDGFIDGTDCSVCLAEFGEDETLRLLPKCSHAFHMQCIDTWLRSHSNCPLCRSIVVAPVATTVPPEQQQAPEQEDTIQAANETHVILISDLERGREEEEDQQQQVEVVVVVEEEEEEEEEHRAIPKRLRRDEGEHGVRLEPTRRSASMDRVSIANILEMGMDEDGSSSGVDSVGEHSKETPPVPLPMKRSFSSGRFYFPKQGWKGS